MAAPIMLHSVEQVDIPYAQIIRYAGMSRDGVPENINELIDKSLVKVQEVIKYKACYLEVPVNITGDAVSLDCFSVTSKNLSVVLKNCTSAILVCATLGPMIDVLVKRAEVGSKAEALILNSIAIAAIEQYMFILNEYFKGQYKEYELRPRYSPGYGDVPLFVQKDLLNVLDTKRKIGVALSDSLLMTPSKSVSAIIGLGQDGCINIDKDCELCSKYDCEFRLS